MIHLVYIKDGLILKERVDVVSLYAIEFSSDEEENAIKIYCNKPHDLVVLHASTKLIIEPRTANSILVYALPLGE